MYVCVLCNVVKDEQQMANAQTMESRMRAHSTQLK